MSSIIILILRVVLSSQTGLGTMILCICLHPGRSSELKDKQAVRKLTTISYCVFAGFTVEQVPFLFKSCQNNLLLKQTRS